jgi:hypothetical protein
MWMYVCMYVNVCMYELADAKRVWEDVVAQREREREREREDK